MSQTKTSDFGKWRSIFWPIHNYELKKIVPMLLLFFFINFNYTILRDTKDSLVVTAHGSGAEVLPYLKVYAVLPMAIVFMIVYSKMSNVMDKKKLFFFSLAPFIIFFALFATVIYPAREHLHLDGFADKMQAFLPAGWFGLTAVVRNWTFSLFYVMSELWGSVATSLLFWGFANDITKISESKRFYAMFGIGANLAMLVSGPLINYLSKVKSTLPSNVDAWGYSLNLLMTCVVASGIVVILIYNWINKNVLTDPRFYDPNNVKKKKQKLKMSIKESFGFLLRSKYILCLAILVISYGICINLVEVTWKNQLKLQYPNPNDYNSFMGKFSFCTGLTTTVMMLFIGGNIMRRLGWKFAALTTPVTLAATGVIFLTVVYFKDSMGLALANMLGTTPLFLAVIVGMVQNIFSKSSKYSLFDPTKEMAYIPLDEESKVKGKAAIDVVGARFGKSGGSLVQQLLLIIGPLTVITPYIAIVLGIILVAWIIAAKSLGTQFEALAPKLKADEDAQNAARLASNLEKPIENLITKAVEEPATK